MGSEMCIRDSSYPTPPPPLGYTCVTHRSHVVVTQTRSHPHAMAQEIRDLFARVVADAVFNYLTRGFLAATGTLAMSPDTDDVRQQLREDSTKWSTLIPNRTQRYTEQEFCLLSNSNIFGEAFLRAYHITERFNVDA